MREEGFEQAMTPGEVVAALDRYIVGQTAAKRAVAVALRDRWRRQQVGDDLRDEISPKNIIMIGPTGVGKSELARRLARLARAPFLKIEASKFTEIGYVGRDVESMVRDLVELAIMMVKREAEHRVASRAREAAEQRVLAQLALRPDPVRAPLDERAHEQKAFVVGHDGVVEQHARPIDRHALLAHRLREGELDDELVELELADQVAAPTTLDPLSSRLPAEQAAQLRGLLEGVFPTPLKKRRLRVKDALRALMREESARLIDMERVVQDALRRTEQAGIIFLDEIDKIATREGARQGPDVSREGVQRDLLPIVEGTSVATRHGVVKTDHILFIAAGAFHVSRPSDLIPELQGRFPIRVELESLTREDFRRILTEPRNSLTRQYVAMMRTEGVRITFEPGAIEAIADVAWQVNGALENIGARRLHTIMERVFEELSFQGPELRGQCIIISAEYVNERLAGILQDRDLSRYIL